MNELPDHTTDSLEPLAPQKVSSSLPAKTGKEKLDRITTESKGLVDDVKAWVDLRIKLVKTEVEQEVKEQANEAIQDVIPVAIPAVIGILGALFALVTTALGIGWWLGRPFWGFLAVTLILLFGALLTRRILVRKQQRRKKKRIEASV